MNPRSKFRVAIGRTLSLLVFSFALQGLVSPLAGAVENAKPSTVQVSLSE